jgi:hypothetical protein
MNIDICYFDGVHSLGALRTRLSYWRRVQLRFVNWNIVIAQSFAHSTTILDIAKA